MTYETTLTERYVAATVRRVPDEFRAEVAERIRQEITTAIDSHLATGSTPQQAERQALTDLGDPGRFAVRFGGHPRYLIGPARFDEYLRLLRLLLVTVLPTIGVLMLILQGMTGSSVLDVFTSTLSVVFQVGIQLAFWVTLAFAILDRREVAASASDWTPEDLPEPVDRRITRGDTVVSVALLSVLIWAILWQKNHWLITLADGSEVPVLNPDLWSFWLPLALIVVVASIALEVVKYAVGRWTVGLAAVNTVLNVAFAGIVLWLWSGDVLVNPAVVAILPEGVGQLISTLPWVIVAICVFDTAQGWWRALRGADDRR